MLAAPEIYQALGFPSPIQGYGQVTLGEAVARIMAEGPGTTLSPEHCTRAGLGLRNTTTHSLAWTEKISPSRHQELFLRLIGAITHAIRRLYFPPS
jgi:hypothetical protein